MSNQTQDAIRLVCGAAMLWLALSASPAQAQQPATPLDPSATALNDESRNLSNAQAARSADVAQLALQRAREAGDRINAAEALHNLAVAHRNLGRYDLAAQFAQQSVDGYIAAGDRRGEAQGYNTLGLISSDRGDYPRALELHHKALAIRLERGDREDLAFSYNNLGNMYRNVQDYTRALEHHFRALEIKKTLDNPGSLAFSYANIGNVYRSMGDTARAIESYREALRIRLKLDDPRGLASTYNSIALALERTDPSAALIEYQKALALRQQINDRRGVAGTLTNIGNVQRMLDQPAKAVATLTRALAIADEIRAPVVQIEIYQRLSESEAARGNFKAALNWHQQYADLKDQTFNQQNSDRLNRLNAAYEASQREQQIALLDAESRLKTTQIQRQRIAGAAGAIIGGVLLLMYVSGRRSARRYRLQAEELQQATATARTLRGLLPICASCKNIRDDRGAWQPLERFIRDRSEADFTHGYCPLCSDATLADAEADRQRVN